MDIRLFIIVPCYNEEEVLPITSKMLLNELNDLISKNKISYDSRIMFVNDGSKDQTWEIIKELSRSDEHFIGITQSRNRGHQNAVLAGLMTAKNMCDITISIDADGQDDITIDNTNKHEYRVFQQLSVQHQPLWMPQLPLCLHYKYLLPPWHDSMSYAMLESG